MRIYELTFIIAPTVEDEGVQATVEKVTAWIEAGEGKVEKVDIWGRRQLAYPIRDFREGTYVLLEVLMAQSALGELERSFKLDLDIIRYLLVRKGE
ncbi:MAG: 30S ribosomal protein S6 [Chloroflexota bacterium]